MARLVCFASDLTDVAQLRRLASFQALGHEVISVASRKGPLPVVNWQNIDLGEIGQHGLLRRGRLALATALRDPRLAPLVQQADLLVARNVDMLALAAALRLRCGATAPIAYEVLDIHSLFEGASLKSRMARWGERRLMAGAEVLWLSSPGFYTGYFAPVQGYSGPWHLVENKMVVLEDMARPVPNDRVSGGDALQLGWIGAIRCRPSFELLLCVAEQMGQAVEVHIHGKIHDHVLPDFHARIAGLGNVIFHGAYAYPHGLAACYDNCDVVWAQDLWQMGDPLQSGNSDLLLPNRIYEAGWHGCPVIAVSGTETGHKIEATGQGWTLGSADAEALIRCLQDLTPSEIAAARQRIAELPETVFRQTPADVVALLASAGVEPCSSGAGAPRSKSGA
ncbi:glycosyl transferase family 1 [Phaeobacter inhibens]|uniref:glycosyltransferase family 1 protein n=1 Tax=Phaeobacter inhibens TaxID=221822 RepID=UPI0021A764C2|nr:glycosyltransferase family 1 protein [Phaeobacter inhibens]UWR90604.1 glycosyltransferase family 1 protein [Phaeobacter inhibens]GLO72360.1 glycosyl transferase family 1 [Phaeobacter inhibens]